MRTKQEYNIVTINLRIYHYIIYKKHWNYVSSP